MCITEEKLVEAYGNSNPHERFLLIYKNYSVFPQLVDCYETGLFNRILFEVEYNRRKKNDDDLGVRVQTSHHQARRYLTHAITSFHLGLIITRRWMKNGCLRLKQSLIPDWKK